MTPEDVQQLFDEIDEDGNGELDFDEFVRAIELAKENSDQGCSFSTCSWENTVRE